MIAKKYLTLIALGACLVGVSSLGSQKHPVQRPFKALVHLTVVISPDFTTWENSGWGNATHLGLYTSHGSGTYEAGVPIGTGVSTAANGDQVFWEGVVENGAPVTLWRGGTGRFEGAAGRITGTPLDLVVTYDPDTGRTILDITMHLEGTITY